MDIDIDMNINIGVDIDVDIDIDLVIDDSVDVVVRMMNVDIFWRFGF